MSRLTALSRFSTRPRFRIVRPDGDAVILQFPINDSSPRPTHRAEAHSADCVSVADYRLPKGREALLARARALHRNRCCPHCHRGGVIPVDLGDGDDRFAAMPVPGTSTLVGFYCDACGAEWPV
jgi:hypothetical protein